MRPQQACMCHMWSLTDVRLSCWEISAADIHPLMSCLLAKTRSAALRSSWNHNIIPTETFKYLKKLIVVNMLYMWLSAWKGGSEVCWRLRLQTREVHNACLSRLCNPLHYETIHILCSLCKVWLTCDNHPLLKKSKLKMCWKTTTTMQREKYCMSRAKFHLTIPSWNLK